MSTLAELQTQMADADPNVAIPAGNTLANYYGIYNDEYNTLLMKRQEAETSLFDASHDSAGVDHAEVLHLQGLILGIESRMKVQDGKMIAFQASGLSIEAPDAALVENVQQLCAQVSAIASRDAGIEAIMLGLGQIAGIVNQVQGS